MTNDAKRSRKERVLEKAKQLIVIVSYLWVFLSVLQLHRAFILAEHKIQYSNAEGLVFALINAWVLGKFVLIGESLFAGARWHSQPLLYLILYKSAVCGTILIVCNLNYAQIPAASEVGPSGQTSSFLLAEVLIAAS